MSRAGGVAGGVAGGRGEREDVTSDPWWNKFVHSLKENGYFQVWNANSDVGWNRDIPIATDTGMETCMETCADRILFL